MIIEELQPRHIGVSNGFNNGRGPARVNSRKSNHHPTKDSSSPLASLPISSAFYFPLFSSSGLISHESSSVAS